MVNKDPNKWNKDNSKIYPIRVSKTKDFELYNNLESFKGSRSKLVKTLLKLYFARLKKNKKTFKKNT